VINPSNTAECAVPTLEALREISDKVQCCAALMCEGIMMPTSVENREAIGGMSGLCNRPYVFCPIWRIRKIERHLFCGLALALATDEAFSSLTSLMTRILQRAATVEIKAVPQESASSEFALL
jgi:hypothetical protein